MKRLLKVKILLIIIVVNSTIQSQNNSLSLVDDLASGSFDNIRYALNKIISDSLVEYIPYLEENIFNQTDESFVEDYLRALNRLKSPNIILIAKAYIDSVYKYDFYDLLGAQVIGVAVLVVNGDYSKNQYLFDYIERERPCLGLENYT